MSYITYSTMSITHLNGSTLLAGNSSGQQLHGILFRCYQTGEFHYTSEYAQRSSIIKILTMKL